MKILSLDFGTSSVKLAVLDKNLEIVFKGKEEYKYTVREKNKIEIEPDVILDKTLTLVKSIDKTLLEEIEVISYDVFSPSLVCMDKKGQMLYPCIFYLDKRSEKQTKKILKVFGRERYLNLTGVLPFPGGVTLTSLLWIKENRPEIYKKTYKFGHLNTYINFKLTGKWAIDPVNASMMGIYETTKWGGWSEEICRAFEIEENKLPKIINSGKIIGGLRSEIASRTGLKEGTPVILGSNDAATAILGAGNEEEGDILNIAGSNEICTILTEKPIVNESYYLRNSLFEGKWQIFSINIGGFAIEWFREQFCRDMKKNEFYEEYLQEIKEDRLEEFYSSSTEKFKPYLAGDRHDLKLKRGSFEGLTLNTTREDLILSILLGIHEPILNNLSITRDFLELNKDIVVTGGLAECSYYDIKSKILKDFNLNFKSRTTTIGNGKLALRGLKGER